MVKQSEGDNEDMAMEHKLQINLIAETLQEYFKCI